MFQKVDLNENSNLFVASVILITGVGGMVIKIGKVEIRTVACALIMGIITNIFLSRNKEKTEKENTENSSENEKNKDMCQHGNRNQFCPRKPNSLYRSSA